MPADTTRDQHERLMTRMARTLGADLDDAELRGDLPPEMRDDMLSACVGCSDPQGCAHWLAKTQAADTAPGFCRNGGILAALAAE
ncbi:DUF6455 family protein [Roseicyclus marinus]|uniref:DUF6455 family protein n=1 Tax=Roseicyclus marinus TaxID=2161673 RepID=UPI00240FEA3F|nr:DUF6455 family protein [Roseicyclus marinus]MDG3042065.1 DUF6455 family protein [Roseicyclus marinus]